MAKAKQKTDKKIVRYDPDKHPQMLIDGMAEGLGVRAVAGIIGISARTLYYWIEQNEELNDAFEIGLSKSRLFWERLGVQIATGAVRGNPIVYINSMSNKFEDWGRDGAKTEQGEKTVVEVKMLYDPTLPAKDEEK